MFNDGGRRRLTDRSTVSLSLSRCREKTGDEANVNDRLTMRKESLVLLPKSETQWSRHAQWCEPCNTMLRERAKMVLLKHP